MNPQMRVVADGLRFPEGPIALEDGSVLVVEIAGGCLTRVRPGGEVQVVAQLGGGPNGAAIGPDGHCYVCNNGGFKWMQDAQGRRPAGQADDYSGGRIERVDLTSGRVETLYTRGPNGPLRGPNDIVFDSHGGFWFTDLGKVRDRDMDRGGVYYARADGSLIEEAIFPMILPNGIGLSPDDRQLYVVETEGARVWSFDLAAPGKINRKPYPAPHGGRLVVGLSGFQRIDSMAVEACGNLCLATLNERHGITVVSPDGKVVEHISLPDPYTTNICFGGAELKDAYVTMSSQSKLVAVDWARTGLPLHFLNQRPLIHFPEEEQRSKGAT